MYFYRTFFMIKMRTPHFWAQFIWTLTIDRQRCKAIVISPWDAQNWYIFEPFHILLHYSIFMMDNLKVILILVRQWWISDSDCRDLTLHYTTGAAKPTVTIRRIIWKCTNEYPTGGELFSRNGACHSLNAWSDTIPTCCGYCHWFQKLQYFFRNFHKFINIIENYV